MKKILFLFLVLAGCASTQAPVAKDTMAALLFDLHLAEARANLLLNDSAFTADTVYRVDTRRQDSLAVYYQRILARHKVSYADFSAALDWYAAHPAQLDSAYKGALVLAGDTAQKAP